MHKENLERLKKLVIVVCGEGVSGLNGKKSRKGTFHFTAFYIFSKLLSHRIDDVFKKHRYNEPVEKTCICT